MSYYGLDWEPLPINFDESTGKVLSEWPKSKSWAWIEGDVTYHVSKLIHENGTREVWVLHHNRNEGGCWVLNFDENGKQCWKWKREGTKFRGVIPPTFVIPGN